jgi:hypothetical protein
MSSRGRSGTVAVDATSNAWSIFKHMADPLYLSLWFPGFAKEDILARTASVLRQFPFSAARLGVTYVVIQPVGWEEATVLEQRFAPGIAPEEAMEKVADLLHDDYAYVFEAWWDLWAPNDNGDWTLLPHKVTFVAQGKEFDEAAYTESGHVQIDFGPEASLTEDVEQRVRANITKLVDFTNKLEQNLNLTGRVLWSESEENLAQKLISRLQQVH